MAECLGDCERCHLPYCIMTDDKYKQLWDEVLGEMSSIPQHPVVKQKQGK